MTSQTYSSALIRVAAALFSLLVACSGLSPSTTDVRAARPITYVAIGASDTVGVGANNPESESWPAVLARKLPPGSRLLNLGVSGSLLHQALDQQVPVAVDVDPDLVTVWLSVNDYTGRVRLEQYETDLDALLGALRAASDAVILVGNVPDLSALPIASRLDLRDVDRWNATIDAVSARHGATVVDLHGTWQEVKDHPEYISSDGFHPSTSGYARLADVFYATASEQLAASADVPSSAGR